MKRLLETMVFSFGAGLITCAVAFGCTVFCNPDYLLVNDCCNYSEDINSCGTWQHIIDTCSFISTQAQDCGCCSTDLTQYVTKSWYDCNGDGAPDCEWRVWSSGYKAGCC